MKKNFFACVIALFTLPALADGFYVTGDIGQAKWSASSGSDTDVTFAIAGGYEMDAPFNDAFAIELGYHDLGSINATDDSGTYNADLTATQISVLSSHSINDSVSLYGRLGYADLQMDTKFDDGVTSDSGSISEDKVVYGIGGRYAISHQFGAHIEYDRYGKWLGITVSTLTVGIDYQF